jgi:hypothetical protein
MLDASRCAETMHTYIVQYQSGHAATRCSGRVWGCVRVCLCLLFHARRSDAHSASNNPRPRLASLLLFPLRLSSTSLIQNLSVTSASPRLTSPLSSTVVSRHLHLFKPTSTSTIRTTLKAVSFRSPSRPFQLPPLPPLPQLCSICSLRSPQCHSTHANSPSARSSSLHCSSSVMSYSPRPPQIVSRRVGVTSTHHPADIPAR